VLLAHDVGFQNAGGGSQRVHGGIDALLDDFTAQDGGSVQMCKGGSGSGVGQVIGGDVDGLHRGDGAIAGGGDTLLQSAQLVGQRGLIADSRGHTAHQSGDLRAGLHETENIVDEEQHVLVGLLAEILGHGQAGLRHPHTGSWGLIHLAEDQRGLVQDAGGVHLTPEVAALTGALADAGEDGVAAVLGGHVVDQLLDQDGLADACAAEQTDLAALGVGGQQVDDLDARFQNLSSGLLLCKAGGLAVDGPVRHIVHRALAVDGAAQRVEHTAQRGLAHRGSQTFAGREHDAAHRRFVDVLRHLHRALGAFCGHGQRFLQGRQSACGELHVHHRAGHANNFSLYHRFASFIIASQEISATSKQHICDMQFNAVAVALKS